MPVSCNFHRTTDRPESSKIIDGLSQAEIARMEREMGSVTKDFKQIEETYGKNVLNLVIVVGYLKRLLDNARVVRYLAQSYLEILTELQKIIEGRSLTDAPETPAASRTSASVRFPAST
jgi:hypothetical protein